MKWVMVLSLSVLVVSAVAQDTSRIGAGDYANPSGFFDLFVEYRQADVLVAGDFAGGTFTDLTGMYATAFEDAGASSTETITAPSGAPIPFPSPLLPSDYPVVVVLTAENWWDAPDNFQYEDAQALIDYMEEGGGNLLIVGQDLLWGYQPGWGTPNDGLFDDYMGVASVTQDVFYDEATTTWTGYGCLDGLSGTGVASSVFTATDNLFFTDDLTPATRAEVVITGEPDYSYDFAVACDTGSTKGLFSTFELGSDSSNFGDMIQAIYDWFGANPDEQDPTITDTYPMDADYPSGVPPTDNTAGCHWQDGDPSENSGIDVEASSFVVYDPDMDPVTGDLTTDDTDEYDVIVDFEADDPWEEGATYSIETETFDNAGNSASDEWTFDVGYTNVVESSFGAIKAGFAQ